MSDEKISIKQEPPQDTVYNDDDEGMVEPPSFAAALGLHRVGSVLPPKPQPQQPIQVLNARGMPARIRKKNKLFFDDDIVNDKPQRISPTKKLGVNVSSPKAATSPNKTPSKLLKKRKGVVSRYMKAKESGQLNNSFKRNSLPQNATVAREEQQQQQKPTNAISTLNLVDRKIGQRIGLRLRNLLKLPKAHKWVSYEWFYSYIDKPLFFGPNDFQICLKEIFPQLKTSNLTRFEWSKIRRIMGKPRRCSQTFFNEERRELERRRQKIRLLQSRKSADAAYVRDLPPEIPLALPVGTKVTARLRQPQDGIFTGSIVAVDSLSSLYRITFDRPGLGTHSVPDFEVLSIDFVETIPLSAITQDSRQKHNGGTGNLYRKNIGALFSHNKSDPLLGSEIYNNLRLKDNLPKETIGGFQLKLLELVIRTKKTLGAKQMKLLRLKNMNSEAELYKSSGESFPDDFQRRYASIVIGMEKLNRDMQDYLSQIQSFTRDLTKKPIMVKMMAPSYLREKCKELGNESVQKNNQEITDDSMLSLITDLATLMWITSNLSGDDKNAHVLKVLEVCLEEARLRLDPQNMEVFQKNVQVHLRHIEKDLQQQSANAALSDVKTES